MKETEKKNQKSPRTASPSSVSSSSSLSSSSSSLSSSSPSSISSSSPSSSSSSVSGSPFGSSSILRTPSSSLHGGRFSFNTPQSTSRSSDLSSAGSSSPLKAGSPLKSSTSAKPSSPSPLLVSSKSPSTPQSRPVDSSKYALPTQRKQYRFDLAESSRTPYYPSPPPAESQKPNKEEEAKEEFSIFLNRLKIETDIYNNHPKIIDWIQKELLRIYFEDETCHNILSQISQNFSEYFEARVSNLRSKFQLVLDSQVPITDPQILIHFFCLYFDKKLSKKGPRYFTDNFFKTIPNKDFSSSDLIIYQSANNPPHFDIIFKKKYIQIEKNDNVIFAFLILLYLVKTEFNGYLGSEYVGDVISFF